MHEIKTKLETELPTSLFMGCNQTETAFLYQLRIRLSASFTFNLQDAGQKLSD